MRPWKPTLTSATAPTVGSRSVSSRLGPMTELVLALGAVVALTSLVVAVALLVSKAGNALVSPRGLKWVFVVVIGTTSINALAHFAVGQRWVGLLYTLMALSYLYVFRELKHKQRSGEGDANRA